MNKWIINKSTGQDVIAGRGVLINFIPVENGIRFNKGHPFRFGDLLIFKDKEYSILNIETLNNNLNRDIEPFGFLIKKL